MPDQTFIILADSHVPDRLATLPVGLIEAFRAIRADGIWHLGDICDLRVLRALESIAPVTAVQGNRDWLFRLDLPVSVTMQINGKTITLAHGHLSFINYWVDKFQYLFTGYQFTRYQKSLQRHFPDRDLILFGHTHDQVCRRVGKTLFLNPGSIIPCFTNDGHPQYAVLTIDDVGNMHVMLKTLEEASHA